MNKLKKSDSFGGLVTIQQMDDEFNRNTLLYRKEQEKKIIKTTDQNEKTCNSFYLLTQDKQRSMKKIVKMRGKNKSPITQIPQQIITNNLKDRVRKFYNLPIRDQQHQRVCQKVRNTFIGSFFEGLIMFSVHNLKNKANSSLEAYTTEYGEIEHFIQEKSILNEFNISGMQLDALKKPQDKIKFILDTMNLNIRVHVEHFEKLYQERIRQQTKFDDTRAYKQEKMEKQIIRTLSINQSGLIHSKFKAIKGKLYQFIISKIDEYENQVLVSQAINQGRKLNALSNFQGVGVDEVLSSENQYGVSLKQLHQCQLSKYRIGSPLKTRVWEPQSEEKYEAQMQGRRRVRSTLAYSEMIHEAIKVEAVQRDRKFLLEKYFDQGLSAEEIKFLNDTCDLINQNIDKEFEKKKLGSLDQQLINQMELKVVEELLNHFSQLKAEYMRGRHVYLKKKNATTIQKNHLFHLMRQKVVEEHTRRSELQRNADLFGFRVDNAKSQFQTSNVKIYVKMFIEGLRRNVIKARENRYQKEVIKYLRQEQVEFRNKFTFYVSGDDPSIGTHKTHKIEWGKFFDIKLNPKQIACQNLKVKKAVYHPPSKLLVESSKQDQKTKEELIKLTKQLYKRNYKDTEIFKDQKSFKKFYSGGPIQNPNLPLAMLHKYATVIQKFFRGYRTRQQFQDQIESQYKHLARKVHILVQSKNSDQLVGNELTNLKTTFSAKYSIFGSYHRLKNSLTNRVRKEDTQEHILYSKLVQQRVKSSITIGKSSKRKVERSTMATELGRSFAQTQQETQASLFKNKRSSSMKAVVQVYAHETEKKIRALFRMSQSNQISKLHYSFTPREVNSVDDEGYTPLYYACLRGCLQVTSYFMEIGGDVNQKCRGGNTPLHVGIGTIIQPIKTIGSRNQELILYFFQNKLCNFNTLNNENNTPLALCPKNILDQFCLTDKVVISVKDETVLNFDNNIVIFGQEEQKQMDPRKSSVFSNNNFTI